MKLEQARVKEQCAYSGEYRFLSLECPAIASAVQPGQFVHLHVPRLDTAVLRRPFSVFKADSKAISILYKPIGQGTEAMTRLVSGDELSLMGPLGNGFPLDPAGAVPVLVAGGYGVAPLCFLAGRLPTKGLIFIGGATATDVLCEKDFGKLGWEVRVATEDGSQGERGLVTVALDAWLSERRSPRTAAADGGDAVPPSATVGRKAAGKEQKKGDALVFYACGPDGMLRAVGDRAARLGANAWLSLDKHMGCGVGACLACVQKIRGSDGKEVWARVCRDGPIFESRQVVWN